MIDSEGTRWEVPIIDISGFFGNDETVRGEVARKVDHAARTVGFMQVTGHGIEPRAISELGAAMDAFFGRPLEEKIRVRPAGVHVNRGYTAPGTERLSYSLGVDSAADLFEAFNIGVQASDFPILKLPLADYPENIWPDEPPQFRPQISAWFTLAGQLARKMTRIFEAALGLPDQYFAPYQDHSVDVLRLNLYSVCDENLVLEHGQMGMGAHTDFGIVTVLWADPVSPGLQVLDSEGVWHDIVPAPGAMLINLGDMMTRWTNDLWMSSMHRVLPSVDDDGHVIRRRSAAFFHDGNFDAVVSCLPGCSDSSRPPRYVPITVAEHVAAKLAGSRGLRLNEGASHEANRLLAAQES